MVQRYSGMQRDKKEGIVTGVLEFVISFNYKQ